MNHAVFKVGPVPLHNVYEICPRFTHMEEERQAGLPGQSKLLPKKPAKWGKGLCHAN